MHREEIRICILRVGGTNCDSETKRSLEDLGVVAEIHHTNEMIRKNNLSEFDGLVLPGGFSFGDYVRAGAILAKRITSKLGNDLKKFIEEGTSPKFDLLIIDEAQDLAPLQWRMVKEVLVPNSKKVYYAGDDDQAIYTWMGVRVSDFLNSC